MGCMQTGETAKIKLTPDLQAEIAKNVSRGMTNDRACRLAGIHRSTFYHWLRLDKESKSGKYSDFLDTLKKVESSFVATRRVPITLGRKTGVSGGG